MAIDHKQRARRAWPYLVKRASTTFPPFTYTYGELSAKIGVHHRAAGRFLDVIQRKCRREKWPFLNALAVAKGTGLPGKGYNGSPRSHAAHQRMIARVRARKWPLRAPF